MAKALDTRIVAKAKLGDIRLSLNLKTESRAEDPEHPGEFIVTVAYLQMATIDYDLVDAAGDHLGRRTLTHQSAGVEVKPTLQQAIAAVGAELKPWISADRIALSDVDA